MAQLLVRNLEQSVVDALRRRAADHHRSAEAEHRDILRAALLEQPPKRLLKEVLAAMPYFDDGDVFEVR
jgi:plasmid stability protein